MSQVNLSFDLGLEPTIDAYSPIKVNISSTDKMAGSDQSLLNTNMSKIEDRISGMRETLQRNSFMSDQQNLQFQDKFCCIEPLCFQKTKIFSYDEGQAHKDHNCVSMNEIIRKLKLLKCNSKFTFLQSQKITVIFEGMDKIFNEIVEFQSQVIQIFTKIKIQTRKHIDQVKKSFGNLHFQQTKNKLISQFNQNNVNFALNEIKKYQKLSYPNLDYPLFKVNLVQKRISQLNKPYKQKFLIELKSFIAKFCGDNTQNSKTKKQSRSTITFMYKNVSEQPIFSYYLKNNEYQVSKRGGRLRRVDIINQSPIAFIEKRIDENPIKIRINKTCLQGIVIGCSPLSSLEKTNFQNIQNNGYFFHNSGVVLSLKSRYKNAFKYSQNDIVSVRIQKRRLLFNKLRDESLLQGFSIDLFQTKKIYSEKEKFYVSVMLGSLEAQVQIIY